MKLFSLKTLAFTALAAGTVAAYSASVEAQTVTVNASVTVANTITLTKNSDIDFGTIIAINEAANTATLAINAAGALQAPTTTGGSARIVSGVAGTPAGGSIDLTGVDGNTVNVTFTNVVNPTDGTDTITLDTFTRTFTPTTGAAASGAVVVDTPFTVTVADDTPDTLTIGASITTPAQAALVGDGTYAGSFDVVFSY